jgi:hypothetical protein
MMRIAGGMPTPEAVPQNSISHCFIEYSFFGGPCGAAMGFEIYDINISYLIV